MLATNKTPLLDQQDSSKQNLFELIKVVYEVIEDKQDSIPQVYTIPEVAKILKCKIKTVEGHLYNARNLSYLKVGREVRIRVEDLREFLENRLTPCVKVRSLK
ncbi:MAG: helix-turn-helix domain-containing protein [SAR324 cluster bacterium]|nr:helix-turn-helix domain-containing protein [SAR324 cluster bacterium]